LSWWDLAYISGFTPWDTGSPPSELVSLLEQGLLKPCRALDVGCGTGGLVVYLAKKGFDVTGVDISAVAIRKARARAIREGVKANLIKMDFTDVGRARLLGRFDLVTDVGCYHSLSQECIHRVPQRGYQHRRHLPCMGFHERVLGTSRR
jgi:SAM-dependent methyltransferase